MADESAADRWFYKSDGKKHGPVSLDKLRQLLAQKTIPTDSLVWHNGMESWTPAAEAPELQGIQPATAAGAARDPRLRRRQLTIAIAVASLVIGGMLASQISFRRPASPPPPSSLTEQLVAIGRAGDLAAMPVVVTAITNPDSSVATTAVTVAERLLGVRYSEADRSNLGSLVGLLLPAVQASRASARAAKCAANLHQIGIAYHSYLSAQPSKTTGLPAPGWCKRMMPFLEE